MSLSDIFSHRHHMSTGLPSAQPAAATRPSSAAPCSGVPNRPSLSDASVSLHTHTAQLHVLVSGSPEESKSSMN